MSSSLGNSTWALVLPFTVIIMCIPGPSYLSSSADPWIGQLLTLAHELTHCTHHIWNTIINYFNASVICVSRNAQCRTQSVALSGYLALRESEGLVEMLVSGGGFVERAEGLGDARECWRGPSLSM